MGFTLASDGSNRWTFEGSADRLLGSKVVQRDSTQEQNRDETVLVDYQILRGMTAKGGPIELPGIRVLRLTPQYVVSVELNFDGPYYDQTTKGYKQPRETVSRELVEIAKSVAPTLGQPGPSVRNP